MLKQFDVFVEMVIFFQVYSMNRNFKRTELKINGNILRHYKHLQPLNILMHPCWIKVLIYFFFTLTGILTL